MLFEHAPRTLTHRTRGGDEGHFPQHEHLTAHDARHHEPFDDAEREDHDEDAAVRDRIAEKAFGGGPLRALRPQARGIERVLHIIIQRRDEDHDEKDARDGLQHLRGTHHEGIHLAARVAADHAVERADDETQKRARHTDAERYPRAAE